MYEVLESRNHAYISGRESEVKPILTERMENTVLFLHCTLPNYPTNQDLYLLVLVLMEGI